jgi:hypothetical protein
MVMAVHAPPPNVNCELPANHANQTNPIPENIRVHSCHSREKIWRPQTGAEIWTPSFHIKRFGA